ncbi:MAG: toll/interleukin-1 receptor domain-containing protein, partial [Haliscomenobacter sp.]|nr:toll/interleukin-1 receptor domain-containing protein [Haliscomenobacter sp.]
MSQWGWIAIQVSSPCSFDSHPPDHHEPSQTLLSKHGLSPTLYGLPSLFSLTLRLLKCYLAHASANKAFARKLYEALIQKGVQVWFDIKKLKPGDEIYEGISRGITHYDKMILVCSRESLAESWWVDREIDRVLKKERELFRERKRKHPPAHSHSHRRLRIRMERRQREDVRRYTIGDFKEWQDETKFDQALNELIQALR